MYTNEELINKIKDIISSQLIVKEAEYPYAFTLQTGVSKKIEFPSKLSVFDIFTPNRTLDTTPVMLTLKTENGYIIVTCDVTITEDDNLVITDIGQSEFIFNKDTLHITNIEPLKKSVDHILTPEIFEVICVDNNDYNAANTSDFHFKKHVEYMQEITTEINKRLRDLILILTNHSLINDDNSATIKLTTFENRNISPSRVCMLSKSKLSISDNWFNEVGFIIDLNKRTIIETHAGILTNHRILTDYATNDREKIGSQVVVDTDSFKGTYLESFIYDDTEKTRKLLGSLIWMHSVRNIEQILKIIKDKPHADNLLDIIIENGDVTDILRHPAFYNDIISILKDHQTYAVVSNLRNKVSKQIIKFVITLMDKNPMVYNKLDDMVTYHNLDITPFIKSLYKTITKIERRFAGEPNVYELLTNIKSNNSAILKNKLDKICDTPDADLRINMLVELFFTPELTNLSLALVDKDFITYVSNKNISGVDLIHKINAISERSYNAGEHGDIFENYPDMMNMYKRITRAGIFVTLPKKLELYDITVLHDEFTAIINNNKDSISEKAFNIARENYLKYEFKDETFSAIVPENGSSLYEEGISLSHCVASYSDRFIDGSSAILFIRKNNDLSTPFYTMEINPKTNEIIQVRGKYNKNMSNDVVSFVNKINKIILKKTV